MSSMFERMVEWRNWMRQAGYSSREIGERSGAELRAIRAAKGVGRPATITLARRNDPARRFRAGMRVAVREMTKNMFGRVRLKIGAPIFMPPMSDPWDTPVIDSTAALRKPKRRRGKG